MALLQGESVASRKKLIVVSVIAPMDHNNVRTNERTIQMGGSFQDYS